MSGTENVSCSLQNALTHGYKLIRDRWTKVDLKLHKGLKIKGQLFHKIPL